LLTLFHFVRFKKNKPNGLHGAPIQKSNGGGEKVGLASMCRIVGKKIEKKKAHNLSQSEFDPD